MAGDVFELPHLKDEYALDDAMIALKRYYVITEVSRAAAGFSQTWYPHMWRIKCEPLVDSQEFSNILDQPMNKDNYLGDWSTTTVYPAGYTVSFGDKNYLTKIDTPAGIPCSNTTYWQLDTADNLKDILSRYNTNIAINNATNAEAARQLPASGYDRTQLYVAPLDEQSIPLPPVILKLAQPKVPLQLTFVEEKHIYFMKDVDGEIKSNFPSVSKIIKKFHKAFDAEGMALKMSKGDPEGQAQLLAEWKQAGELSTNMGSRVHFELESDTIGRFGGYKDVRQPIFEINEEQQRKSDAMITAGKEFLDLMLERGAVLLDTEIVLGDPEEGYTGQPDKVWLMMNKEKTNCGLVITDWKTNKPKNFVPQWYTGRLYPPFDAYHDTALGHYFLQLPLYGRLLLKMLEGTKFNDLKLLGNVVVLLKDDATFDEYRVPKDISETILRMNLSKYLRR